MDSASRDVACNGGVLCESQRAQALSAGAELDASSRSMWRGLPLSRGPVLQPAVWASAYHVEAIAWGTLLLTDEPPHRRVRSVVPTISYTVDWDHFTFEPGALYYWMGDDVRPRSTVEVFANARATWGEFSVAAEDYLDVKDTPGAYFGSFGPGYEKSVGRWTFKGTADVGWATSAFNAAYFGVDAPALDLFEVAAEVRWDISDNFYCTVHSEASVLLASNLSRAVGERVLAAVGTAFGAEL